MGSQQNSIVLNGKIYDARTGALIHQPAPAPHASKPKVHKKTGLAIDGVIHHPANSHSKKPHWLPVHHVKQPAQPAHHQSTRRQHQVTQAQRHRPQRPATLMRQAVTRPAHRQHHAAETPAHVHDQRTVQRHQRAQAVAKSHHIQHFPQHSGQGQSENPAERSVTKKLGSLPVKPAPAHHDASHTSHRAPTQPPVPRSQSDVLITNALKNARAHEANQPFAKKPRKRLSHKMGFRRHTARLAMGSAAVLLLGGFFLYQNIPNLSMRLASTQAGFNAQLPGYRPAGFSQDRSVVYSPGKVTVSFRSNSDDRNFQLSQAVSSWNSRALADNYLLKAGTPYQTFETNGKTVYIYGGSNATWVSGGVWYQIEGQSSLSSDQLLKIANSI